MFQQISLEKSNGKLYKPFELYKKLCSYSGREFKEESTPEKMLIHTTAGVYTLIVYDEKVYFEGAVTNG